MSTEKSFWVRNLNCSRLQKMCARPLPWQWKRKMDDGGGDDAVQGCLCPRNARLAGDLPITLGTSPPSLVVFGLLYLLIYLVYYHRQCEFLVMMVHVVVPVAIHRPTLDKAVAKEYVLSLMCTAFHAAHVRVAAVRILCFAQLFLRAIFPTTPSILYHRLALVNALW